MLRFLKKIFSGLDKASKAYKTKCDACGTVMQGRPNNCTRCGADLVAGNN